MRISVRNLLTGLFSVLFLLVVFKGTDTGSLPVYAYVTECVGLMVVIAIIGYCLNRRTFCYTVDKWPVLFVLLLLSYILYGYFTFTYSKSATQTFIFRYTIFIPVLLVALNIKDTARLMRWSEKWVLLIAAVFMVQFPFKGGNGSFLGSYQNVAAALSIGLTLMLVGLFTKNKVTRKDVFLVLFVTLTLFMTGKRTFTIIPYVILFFFYLKGTTPSRRKRILRILLPILVMIPVVLVLKPEWLLMLTRIFDPDGGISLTGREHYWELAFSLWRKNILHGIGIGTYSSYIIGNRASVFNEFGVQNVYSTHNIYLQLLAEGGIIGFILWIGFFLCSIVSSYKHLSFVKKSQNLLHIDICSKALALQLWFVLYGFTGNPLTSMHHMYMFMFAVMMIQSVKRDMKQTSGAR